MEFPVANNNVVRQRTSSVSSETQVSTQTDSSSDKQTTWLILKQTRPSFIRKFPVGMGTPWDLSSLLENSVVILEPKHDSLKQLFDKIVKTIVSHVALEDEDGSLEEEIRNQLFTDSTGECKQTSTPLFSNTLQGSVANSNGREEYDQSWLSAFCNVPSIQGRCVAIIRFKNATKLGQDCGKARFLLLVLCPLDSEEPKTAFEIALTLATTFSQSQIRKALLWKQDPSSFRACLTSWSDKMSGEEEETGLFSGIVNDLKRRLPHYWSDYTDGFSDSRAVQKTLSTSIFLYFACLLPTIAFATLNSHTTHGKMDVRKGILAQAIGQLTFGLIGGQHLSILLTTAPLSLFVKIIFSLSESYNAPFEAFYCCVGIWTSFFLILSAVTNASKIMKYCTRSTEEIFALFISTAFVLYAILDTTQEFQVNYNSSCTHPKKGKICHRDSSLLYLLLMFATFWVGMKLYNMKRSKLFGTTVRDVLSDYSLPIAVLMLSFVGSFLFSSVPAEKFVYDGTKPLFQLAAVHELDCTAILMSAVLGFCLAVLIFMDQNIGSAIVNNPDNKLTKGPSYNWDLVVIAVINVFSSLYTLPWLHVALPHTPMHVKCLAEFEEEPSGTTQKIVRVRETRLTSIISHILMGLSLFLLPYPLQYILPSVFDGLYLYMGITALAGNNFFERILGIFSKRIEINQDVPGPVIQVPMKETNIFTIVQLIQLAALCILGFSHQPFVKLAFPLVLLLFLFIRQKLLPNIIDQKYLNILD